MERYLKFNPRPSFSIVADPDRLLSRHFGVGGAFPQTFIIGGDGTVLYHTDEFMQGGERALAGKIERALGLAAGALSSGVSPKTAATPPSTATGSTPPPSLTTDVASNSIRRAWRSGRDWARSSSARESSNWPSSSGRRCFNSSPATPRLP